ncbi:unnamed protein product [Sphagnum balticum]
MRGGLCETCFLGTQKYGADETQPKCDYKTSDNVDPQKMINIDLFPTCVIKSAQTVRPLRAHCFGDTRCRSALFASPADKGAVESLAKALGTTSSFMYHPTHLDVCSSGSLMRSSCDRRSREVASGLSALPKVSTGSTGVTFVYDVKSCGASISGFTSYISTMHVRVCRFEISPVSVDTGERCVDGAWNAETSERGDHPIDGDVVRLLPCVLAVAVRYVLCAGVVRLQVEYLRARSALLCVLRVRERLSGVLSDGDEQLQSDGPNEDHLQLEGVTDYFYSVTFSFNLTTRLTTVPTDASALPSRLCGGLRTGDRVSSRVRREGVPSWSEKRGVLREHGR